MRIETDAGVSRWGELFGYGCSALVVYGFEIMAIKRG